MSDAIITAYREFDAAQQDMLAAAERLRVVIAAEAGIEPDRVDFIINTVATHYGLTRARLLEKTRVAHIVVPRQVAMWLCRQLTDVSYAQIGRALGGLDHSTVVAGECSIEDRLATDPAFATRVHALRTKLEASLS